MTDVGSSNSSEENLLDTPSDVDDNEEEVLNHIMSVSMKSQKYNGKCGRITNVEIVRDKDIPDEQKEFIRQLSQYTDNNKQGFDPDAQEKISQAQKQLRQSMNMDPKDEFEIAVTVELPDGRTFSETFTSPRFDSEDVDNKFLRLYRDILGNKINRKDEIVGCWVPINETGSTYGPSYEIDLNYYENEENSEDNSESGFNNPISNMDNNTKNLGIITLIMGLIIVMFFMI